ncbi:MAG: M56 family metallopeptidase [Bacteroidota bacterium]
MPDLASLLADLGAASVRAFWLPVFAWTVLSLVLEGGLRLGRASARMGLKVRGALVALLLAMLVAPPILAQWMPSVRSVAPAPPSGGVDAPTEAGVVTPLADSVLRDAPALTPGVLDVMLGLAVAAAVLSAVLALGVLIGGVLWLRRYQRTLGAAADPVAADAREVAASFGLRRSPQILVAEPASGPFTVGWWRPVVAVPPDLNGEPLRLALAHEIAHVREAHYGWSLAERAVRALFVWHPLVHVLGRGLALDRERAADAAVLRRWPDRVQTYGHLLHAIASRPSPALALGGASSPLIHRLHAMTHRRPDRPRLAFLAGALVLSAPLLMAAAAVPDAQAVTVQEAVSASVVPPSADSLEAHIQRRIVRNQNGDIRLELVLRPGTPRAVAQAIADHYADGDAPGTLWVTGSGARIEREGLREGVVPPPPPPAVAPVAPPAAPSAPEPPPPPAPEPPPAIAPPPPPPAAIEPPTSLQDLEREAAILREELLAVERDLEKLHASPGDSRAEATLRHTELTTRRDVIANQYRMTLHQLERLRLQRLLREGGDSE